MSTLAFPALLAQPRVSVVSDGDDPELVRIRQLLAHGLPVDGRGALEALLGRLLGAGAPPTPKTLDLIGHSTGEPALLALGGWVIDAASARVRAFFRELAELEVLPRLGVRALRLLGCGTGTTSQGRATICKLAEILGVEVVGTCAAIGAAHYDARGLREDTQHVLVSSYDLGRAPGGSGGPTGPRRPRDLDVDALPASPPSVHPPPWPRRIATAEAARALLGLVRRTEGAEMPLFNEPPSCEIALPSSKPGWYHTVEVVLDGAFVRVYPDGTQAAGLLYPVADPAALRLLAVSLPPT